MCLLWPCEELGKEISLVVFIIWDLEQITFLNILSFS